VVSRSYEFGRFLVGIQTNSEALGAWLDDCLGRYRTDEEAEPYYSIIVEGKGGGPVRRYHMLYRDTMKISKTFDLAGLGRTLLTELESLAFPERDDAVYADLAVVGSNGALALMPAMTAQYLDTLGRSVQRAGMILPVETKVAIDPSTGEAIPIRPLLDLPEDALERLAEIAPGGKRDRIAVDEPTKIETVISIGLAEEMLQPVSAGLALYRLGSHALNLQELGPSGLEGLRRVVEGARCYEVRSAKPQEMLDALSSAIGHS
jgi:hypothetical protein